MIARVRSGEKHHRLVCRDRQLVGYRRRHQLPVKVGQPGNRSCRIASFPHHPRQARSLVGIRRSMFRLGLCFHLL